MAFFAQLSGFWPNGQATEMSSSPLTNAEAVDSTDDDPCDTPYAVAHSGPPNDPIMSEWLTRKVSPLSPSPPSPVVSPSFRSPLHSPLLSPILGPTVTALNDLSELVLTAAYHITSPLPATAPATNDVSDAIRIQGQLTNVNQLLLNGNVFLNEARDMIKERAQVEREYAHKLETLAKKYRSRMEKKVDVTVWGKHIEQESTLNGCEEGVDVDPPEDVTEDISHKVKDETTPMNGNTLYRAFTSMLDGLEVAARTRYDLSDTFVTNIAESLRSLALRKEEARARHMQFAQKLELERDRIYGEKEKAKARYVERLAEVEAVKQKLERPMDDKTRERTQRQYEQDVADANNLRNLYILSIHVANDHKTKYYTEDLPALLKAMQALYTSRSDGLRDLWRICLSLEDAALSSTTEHVAASLNAVNDMDPSLDVSRHAKYTPSFVDEQANPTEPEDFPFEANDPNDSGELTKDHVSRTFLINHCLKIQKKLDALNAEIKNKEQDVALLQGQLDELNRESSGHPELADETNETLLDAIRLITLLRTSRAIVDCERCVITHAIGELPDDVVPHDFKPASFTIPTACDYCTATIWGISKQGYSCKDCGYNCHTKCEMKVTPDCTKRPGGHLERHAKQQNTVDTAEDTAKPSENTGRSSGYHAIATVLYDYDANTDQELSVNAGGIVRIVEPDSGNGWVRVELNGQEGLVPASYIQIDPDAVRQPEYVQALYDYQARSDVELSIYAGAVIEVTNRDCADGWWEGTLDGQTGQFPINYVTEYTVTADYDNAAQEETIED